MLVLDWRSGIVTRRTEEAGKAPATRFTYASLAVVGDSTWVRISGELDVATAPVLAEYLRSALDGALPTVVDVQRLEFMDCSGLRVLLEAGSRARRRGQGFRVIHASPAIARVFTLTGAGDRGESRG